MRSEAPEGVTIDLEASRAHAYRYREELLARIAVLQPWLAMVSEALASSKEQVDDKRIVLSNALDFDPKRVS